MTDNRTPLTDAQAVDALIGEWSDTYKDFNGIRPRWTYAEMADWSPDRIRAHIDAFVAREVAYLKAEEARRLEAEARELEILAHGTGPVLETAMASAIKRAV